MRKISSGGFGYTGVMLVIVALVLGAGIGVYLYSWHHQTTLRANSPSNNSTLPVGKSLQRTFPGSNLAVTYNATDWKERAGGISSTRSGDGCKPLQNDELTNTHGFAVEIELGGCPVAAGCTPTAGACIEDSKVVGSVNLDGVTKYILAQAYTVVGVTGTFYGVRLADAANCTVVNCPLTINNTDTYSNSISGYFLDLPGPKNTPTSTSLNAFIGNTSVQQAVRLLSTLHYQ